MLNPKPTSIAFAQDYLKEQIVDIHLLAQSGSNRKNYRLTVSNGCSYILTENDFIAENKTFFYFSHLCKQFQIHVPLLLAVDQTETCYLQEDLGSVDLMGVLQKEGYTDSVFNLFAQSIHQLVQLQIQFKNQIDYTQCYDFQVFDDKVVQNDLFYFKNYFLDRLDIPYQKSSFISDISSLSNRIKTLPATYFLYRDFQSRNVMIKQNTTYFIDFQGGMRGFLGYDLVSFIYQAKAALPDSWKSNLKKIYFDLLIQKENRSITELEEGFQLAMILRFFQVFGTYGLRGLVERKTHFIDSIFLNMDNIQFLLQSGMLHEFPTLQSVAQTIVSTETRNKIKTFL